MDKYLLSNGATKLTTQRKNKYLHFDYEGTLTDVQNLFQKAGVLDDYFLNEINNRYYWKMLAFRYLGGLIVCILLVLILGSLG